MQQPRGMPRQSLRYPQSLRVHGARLVAPHARVVAAAHVRRPLPWMATLCLICLLAIVASAPRLDPRPVEDGAARLAVGIMTGAARTFANVPDKVAALLDPHAPHQYWQVGVMADDSAAHASGMRTRIETRLPQRIGGTTTNYFWIGAYMRDGSFLQIGYWVPWYDTRHAGWFYCGFDAGGHKGPCVYGALGTAGGDGTTHTYALEAAETDGVDRTSAHGSGGGSIWQALMDGQIVGAFQWTTGETGDNAPALFAESSGFSPHGSAGQLGPVDVRGGIEARRVGQRHYARAHQMTVAYSAANVCPPYGVAPDGHGGVLLGSGLACPDRFSVV